MLKKAAVLRALDPLYLTTSTEWPLPANHPEPTNSFSKR